MSSISGNVHAWELAITDMIDGIAIWLVVPIIRSLICFDDRFLSLMPSYILDIVHT